ncbi:MAG: hypothetical protein HYZ84_02325 [Candidatus Omnitrophica bacterium]|nr:hypothetical protein [Candidatus Omnitrophota bacterium]
MTPVSNSPNSKILGIFLVVLVNICLLGYFHNRTWLTADDGYYAHVASRILHGEVLGKAVTQQHGPYVHFLNALAFRLFGEDLVSLRYFLVAAGVLQSCLIYSLFLSQGIFPAFLAAVLLTALSFIQSPQPGASWYGLFFAISAVWILRHSMSEKKKHLILGVLLSVSFLFRQLNAFFLGQAVVLALMLAKKPQIVGSGQKFFLARTIIVLFLLLDLVYFFRVVSFNYFTAILFGFWPIAILFFILKKMTLRDKETIQLIARLGLGCLIAFLPIFLYAWKFNAGHELVNDVLGRAFRTSTLPQVKSIHFFDFFLVILTNFRNLGLVYWANSFYWLGLLFASFGAGYCLYKNFRDREINLSNTQTLALISIFYAMTAAFYQIPIYLYYTAGLSLVGFTGLNLHPRIRPLSSIFSIFMIVIAVYSHAGRPADRKFYEETLAGKAKPLEWNNRFPRASLWLEPKYLKIYGPLIKFIQEQTSDQEAIFVIPYDSQIYFFSQRRNPFSFCHLSLSLSTSEDVRHFLENLQRENPKLIIDNHEGEFYRGPVHEPMMKYIQENYDLVQRFGPFNVYRVR